MNKKYLITAALPYVNNIQHLGHMVGCHLPADIFCRFQKSRGNDAIFIGGSDDHGTAVLISAKEYGMQPKELIDKLNVINHKIYETLDINYTYNSGTSTEIHSKITQEFFEALDKNGFIEERPAKMLFCPNDNIALADRFVEGTCPFCGYDHAYGDQCDKCGETYESTMLKNPHCKFCGEAAEVRETKHLYLRLDKLSYDLDKWLESKKDIFRPTVYAEAKRWINEGLLPRCITRDLPWGIKVPKPGYENKVFYVWFDAPIGYISITHELGGDELVRDRWQNPDCQIYNFIGKDNIPFHTIFFPAMMIGAKKYNNATNVVGMGFMNFEGQKFSKSKNVGIFCDGLFGSDIDIDGLRSYLVTVIPENKDSDFRWEGLKDNTNSELVGKFGNLFNRSLNMAMKNFGGEFDIDENDFTPDENDQVMIDAIKTYPEKIAELYDKTQFRDAYKTIMEYAGVGNTYLEKTAPWTMIKNGDMLGAKKVLWLCLNMCASLCIVASPIITRKTKDLWQKQLGLVGDPTASGMWEKASEFNIKKGHKTLAPEPIFARIDQDRLNDLKEQLSRRFDMSKLKDIKVD